MSVVDHSINILSVCSGYGGLDLGVDLALGGAARVVCGVEREAACCAVLAKAMDAGFVRAFPVWSDLRTFDGRPWRGVVDCITGGYPCQPFSFVGNRRGSNDPRNLWPEVARVIAEVEPGIVFFENVVGHLTLGFPLVRRELEGMGYRVAAGLFTAAEVGASHRRERLFILSVADDHVRGHKELQTSFREDRTERDGAELANDSMRGCYGLWKSSRKNGRTEQGGAGLASEIENRVPLFAPGPASPDWQRILADRPHLAPATQPDIRRVDDGRPARVDRLRMLGNGVVPLVAAHAFVSLWACLCEP